MADSTALLSAFVMGAELLLLFVYVREQILVPVKQVIFKAAVKEMKKTAAAPASLPFALKHNLITDAHSKVCLDAYRNSQGMAVVGYVLVTVIFLFLIYQAYPARPPFSNLETSVASAAAGMFVFLISQWLFLKVAVLPYYIQLFNRATGSNAPLFENDPLSVHLTLLGPTILSLFVLATAGIAWFGVIDWWNVGVTIAVSLLSLSTEVVSWLLMKGFAVPAEQIVSAITNASIATLWVRANSNPPEIAEQRLMEALFPPNAQFLKASNIMKHVYRDNYDMKRLAVNRFGDLVVIDDERSEPVGPSVILACAFSLILVPIVAVALRATADDLALMYVQILAIAGTYGIYIVYSGNTATMVRLTNYF